MGDGVTPQDIVVTPADRTAAEHLYDTLPARQAVAELLGEGDYPIDDIARLSPEEYVDTVSTDIAISRALNQATTGTPGESFLFVAGTLLAIILLLAQGGGYVGGAAVAANAARLGRMPAFFSDDRLGIAVIWGISAVLIPIIRQVVVVEAYYAFGFVSAFVITSTAVFFVRPDVLEQRGISPKSAEARSLRFAGLRGMVASYIMALVLVTQKTEALLVIFVAGAAITLFQIYVAHGGVKRSDAAATAPPAFPPGSDKIAYDKGVQRAHDHARQRGVVDALEELIESGALAKFNVGPQRIRLLVYYLYNIDTSLFVSNGHHADHERIEEPNLDLEASYQQAYGQKDKLARRIEDYSHLGIFMFIKNYHLNWVAPEYGRDAAEVQQAMLDMLFPLTPHDVIWKEYCAFTPKRQPEEIWQFSRQRYQWAKEQWPNLSGRITTIWTLQDFGLIPKEIDIKMVISVADGKQFRQIKFHTHSNGDGIDAEKETIQNALK